jgi:hypothetical protein
MSSRGSQQGRGRAKAAANAGPKKADVAKSARYEAKIAKAEAALAATRAEYAAHQAATGARLTPEQQAAAREGTPRVATIASQEKKLPAPQPLPSAGNWENYVYGRASNPYDATNLYGAHQMRALLTNLSMGALRNMSTIVQERNPGTKPARASTRAGNVEYIMQHVAPGY